MLVTISYIDKSISHGTSNTMDYLSTLEAAKKWGISDRAVRRYCLEGKVEGAFLENNRWYIPRNASMPGRTHTKIKVTFPGTLLNALREEKSCSLKGGIYHKVQISLTYNSNHIEGSTLTEDETRFIYDDKLVVPESGAARLNDVLETVNHFECVDFVIDHANDQLTEALIKDIHRLLKERTEDSKKSWFAVGDYKKFQNSIGDISVTTPPEKVAQEMKNLLSLYNAKPAHNFSDLLDFHVKFESIHPFQDGNGRVGRLILFKECLKNDIVPFIIEDDIKKFYYRGLREWKQDKAFLTDTCLVAQDRFKKYLDYFRIPYKD